jgi:hypothetical protein
MELKVVIRTALLKEKTAFCFLQKNLVFAFSRNFRENNVSEKNAAKLYEFDKNLRIFTKIEKGIFVSTVTRIKNRRRRQPHRWDTGDCFHTRP